MNFLFLVLLLNNVFGADTILCTICGNDVNINPREIDAFETTCFHWFHYSCFEPWANQKKINHQRLTCPNCRAVVRNFIVRPDSEALKRQKFIHNVMFAIVGAIAVLLQWYFVPDLFSYFFWNQIADYSAEILPVTVVNNALNPLISMSSKLCFMGMVNYNIIPKLGMSGEIARNAFSKSMIGKQSKYNVSIDKNARSVSLEVDFPHKANISKFASLFARIEPMLISMITPTKVPMKIDSVMMQMYCEKNSRYEFDNGMLHEIGDRVKITVPKYGWITNGIVKSINPIKVLPDRWDDTLYSEHKILSNQKAYHNRDENLALNQLKLSTKKTFMFHHDKDRNKLEIRDVFALPLNYEKVLQLKLFIQTLVKIANFSSEDFQRVLSKISCGGEKSKNICKARERSCASTRCRFLKQDGEKDCKTSWKPEDATDLYYLSKFSEEETMEIAKYLEMIARRDPFFATQTEQYPEFVWLFRKDPSLMETPQDFTYKIPAKIQSAINAQLRLETLKEMFLKAKMKGDPALYYSNFHCEKPKLSQFDDHLNVYLPPKFVIPRSRLLKMNRECQSPSNYDSTTTFRMNPGMIKKAFSQSLMDPEQNYKILIDRNAHSVNLEVNFPYAENIWKFIALFARIEPMINFMRHPPTDPTKIDSVLMQIYCRQTLSDTITSMRDAMKSRDLSENYILNGLKSSMKKNYMFHHDEERSKLEFRELISSSLKHDEILQVQFFIQTLVKISNYSLKDFESFLKKIKLHVRNNDNGFPKSIDNSCASTKCNNRRFYECEYEDTSCVMSENFCVSRYEDNTDQLTENSTNLNEIARPYKYSSEKEGIQNMMKTFENVAKADTFFQNYSAIPNFNFFSKNSSK